MADIRQYFKPTTSNLEAGLPTSVLKATILAVQDSWDNIHSVLQQTFAGAPGYNALHLFVVCGPVL